MNNKQSKPYGVLTFDIGSPSTVSWFDTLEEAKVKFDKSLIFHKDVQLIQVLESRLK